MNFRGSESEHFFNVLACRACCTLRGIRGALEDIDIIGGEGKRTMQVDGKRITAWAVTCSLMKYLYML